MSRFDTLLWVVIPYLTIGIFVVGHIWRYRRDQFTWTTRSTNLLEKRWLKWGSPLFHVGLLLVIGGHIGGLLVPASFTSSIGITEHMYHTVAVWAGTFAGLIMTVGLVILVVRRLGVPRVRAKTSRVDGLVYALLILAVVTGMYATVVENLLGAGYDYRATVAPWFRGLFLLNPEGSLMVGAPLMYQLHAVGTVLLFALWPFSRLVHAWSVPLSYVGRQPILYRSRNVAPRPAASSRMAK